MMSVGYNAGFVVHHICYFFDIFFFGYSKQAMSYILLIGEVQK